MKNGTNSPHGELYERVSTESADAGAVAIECVDESDADVDLDDDTSDADDESDGAAFARVPAGLGAALEQRGFTELTSVQSAVLAPEAEGRDLEISSQTGSGKTVALGFVMANLLARPRDTRSPAPDALIIVPTRELAQQVREELSWLFAGLAGVEVNSVTGGTPVYADRERLRRGARVLVGTPGRLLDHVKSGALDLGEVRELVLDEADQMLDMGFREDLEAILDATPPGRRTHMVSATFPEAIRRLAERYQRDALVIEGTRRGEANADIEHIGHMVRADDRYDALVNLLLLAGEQRTLVFVERRAGALELAERLERDGFAALPLSGELAQNQRDRTLTAFRDGRARVLVATDVASRGIDVPDVPLVIHVSPPIDGQVYTHRSGRTGRAGSSGRSVLFSHPSRRRKVARIIGEAGVRIAWRPVPSAEVVDRAVREREQQKLSAELIGILGAGIEPDALESARDLVSRHTGDADTSDATLQLIAAMLVRTESAGRARARNIEVLSPQQDRGTSNFEPQRTKRFEPPRRGKAPFERGGGSDQPRASDMGKVRFFMNYGANQGASTGRLLAIVCRRGQVSGQDVGAIAVHPNASTFDVNADVAARFEELASRRDPRDSRILIRRDRGPAPFADRR